VGFHTSRWKPEKDRGLVDPRVADSVANRAGQGNKGFDGTPSSGSGQVPGALSSVTIADGVEASPDRAEASLNAVTRWRAHHIERVAQQRRAPGLFVGISRLAAR